MLANFISYKYFNSWDKPTHEIKKSIKEHCIKNLAKYSIPYEFEYRDNLPRTKVGKVDYNNLLEEEKNKNRR